MATSTTLEYDDLPALLTRLTGDEKHDWSALSTLDVLWVLYDRVLRRRPARARRSRARPLPALQGPRPGRLLRRARREGLHRRRRACAGFGDFDSPLGHHPDRMLVPGVEISSGSLGHGLPIAVGRRSRLEARGRRRARVVLPRRRRRARRGQQLGGRPARRPARARPPHRDRRRQPLRRPTTGPAASRRASSSRAGARRASTAATTTRSSGR